MKDQITLQVSDESLGKRLDLYLSNSLKDISRTQIQKLIDENLILVNNRSVKSGYKLKTNDKLFITVPDLKELDIKPEKIKLDIVFEDKDLIVINKPQGMVTHPASGVYKGTLVNALLYHCKNSLSGINGVLRPGIVHRLDKETSGLIIVCKNDKAHREIAKQFKDRKIKKCYLAVVHGIVKYDKGTINKSIGRHKIQREKMAVVKGGRNAVTRFRVLKRAGNYTLLECMPETGRTHQIRVHMSSIGHPIKGDKAYSTTRNRQSVIENPMMLHSYKLTFTHPIRKKEVCLETKTPERFLKFMHGVKV